MATTNRMPAASSNGHAEAAKPAARPQATEAQDMAEHAYKVQAALVDLNYAIKQLRQFRDTGRALDALDRVHEALSGVVLAE